MPRCRALLACAVALLATATLAPRAAADATAAPALARSTATKAQKTYSAAAFTTTNVRREQHQRRAFRHKTCLTRLAKQRAAHLARTHVLEHQSLGPISARCGNGWAGENIAYGYSSGRALVNAWMHSSGHRANILNRHFTHMAVWAVRDGGYWWASQVFWGKP